MISLEWVKDYIDLHDQDLSELAVKITKAGINVEKVITNHIDHLTIGKVISCIPHPDSDHLHVCQVEIGEGVVSQIVCGAPNVREGLKVIVSLPGAILPGDFEIKKSKIRGVESNGMICALYELGLEEKTEETYAKGIYELDDDAPVGCDPIQYLGLDDTLYELDVHKHRNNDCYYHIGFAYEIAAILNRKVSLPSTDYSPIDDDIHNHFHLDVKTEKCPYYLAKMVTDVEISESPEFIKKRLLAAGMRPINNVVDISNYVMLEYGQPLHFFDKDTLGDYILVRDAKDREQVTTLDGKLRTLTHQDIVITNGKDPVCIAGVMGGETTEVTEQTKNILIESAIFDAVSIRNTAAHLNLKSEASIRYGKGLNYEYTQQAIDRACYLLEKYANAKVLQGVVSYDVIDKTPKIVEFTPSDVDQILGISISFADMETELKRLDFPYVIENEKFVVTIPNRRLDVDPNVNDIAEEIGRLYGYHNLVSTLPKVAIRQGQYIGDVKYRKMISKRLRSLGLNEVKTYTLISPAMAEMFDYDHKEIISLPNPMSVDKSVIRTHLIASLWNVYQYNKARKVDNVFIYEIAKTYDKDYQEDSKICGLCKGTYLSNGWSNSVVVDFYLVKGMIENLLNYMGFSNRYTIEATVAPDFHPGICAKVLLDKKEIGIVGRIHPSISKEEVYVFELSMNTLMKPVKALKFEEAPKYPGIEKDMAFVVSRDVLAGDIMTTIQRTAGKLLHSISVFDVYTGENVEHDQKSIAFKLQFLAPDRTLTDDEVMEIFEKIIAKVEHVHKAQLRDK